MLIEIEDLVVETVHQALEEGACPRTQRRKPCAHRARRYPRIDEPLAASRMRPV